jgi:glycosyltransferase involved in cell wall biosynthesis
MKIAVAHESIDTEGGVETYLLSVMAEMRARGHQIALFYHRASSPRSVLRSSAHVSIGVHERGLDHAIRALHEWQPDVCYSHNMGPLDVDRALLSRWPVVKMLHGFFGTCISGLKMHAFPSERACNRVFGPACLALYLPRRCGRLSPGALIHDYRWAHDQRALFTRYAYVVVASRFMGEEVARNGVPASSVRVLPLFSTMPKEERAPIPEKDTVLFAGRMTSLKGGHVLIAAAKQAAEMLGRRVRLVMAGDGPQKETWRALAGSLGVESDFVGWVDFDNRPRVYGRAAVAAMPSLWPEPFGLVGLDAAAVGRPTVAFAVGGIGEWLKDGVNGRLVPPAEGARGLAKAIATTLDNHADRARMSREALNVSRAMTIPAHVTKLETVLRAACR